MIKEFSFSGEMGKGRVAQKAAPYPKSRFYKEVTLQGPFETGQTAKLGDASCSGVCGVFPKGFYSICLDDYPLSVSDSRGGMETAVLCLPSLTLAEAVATEWERQGSFILPETMPLTDFFFAAYGGLCARAAALRDEMRAIAASDLICVRAAYPLGLLQRQAEIWDPVLTWVADRLNLYFPVVYGMTCLDLSQETDQILWDVLESLPPLACVALHRMSGLSASLLLALACAYDRLSSDSAWEAAHLDEDWTALQWGTDSEALQQRLFYKAQFDAAAFVVKELFALFEGLFPLNVEKH